MITIKASTKKGQKLIESARHYDGYRLSDCYQNCSYAKQRAYQTCRDMCDKEGGEDFHISSHNSQFFSVVWEVENGIRMETAYNSYFIEY